MSYSWGDPESRLPELWLLRAAEAAERLEVLDEDLVLDELGAAEGGADGGGVGQRREDGLAEPEFVAAPRTGARVAAWTRGHALSTISIIIRCDG